MNRRLFVVSFAPKTNSKMLDDLRYTCMRLGEIHEFLGYTEESPEILSLCQKYVEYVLHKDVFLHNLWRPFLIHHVLSTKLQEGDVLVYMDASLVLQHSLAPYVRLLDQADIVLTRVGEYEKKDHRQKFFTKEDCFQYMACTDERFREAYQVNASIQFYKKSTLSLEFTEKYYDFCCHIETVDHMSRHPDPPCFQSHRKDQSVLTNLSTLYENQALLVPDCTEFGRSDPNPLQLPQLAQVHRPSLVTGNVWVITPTTGTSLLERCIRSVQEQTQAEINHLIVVDGPEHEGKVRAILQKMEYAKRLHVMVLPENIGGKGWDGHRVYAASPFLVDATYLLYLDEDNWYEPTHVEKLSQAIHTHKADWAYAFRKIWVADTYICHDHCESLGMVYPTVLNPQDFLIDTSSFMFSWRVAIQISPHWLHQARTGDIEADRAVTQFLLSSDTRGVCSYAHTLNYTVARISNKSVTQDFFLQGNAARGLDFTKPTLYVFHFNAVTTHNMLESLRKNDRSYALDEWQMTLFRGLVPHFNLLNGFLIQKIPVGSVAVVTMCHAHELPLHRFREKDWKKILITVESPNLRHQPQWDIQFLKTHFDHILTYWKPLLQQDTTTFCPQNSHHLDLRDPLDRALLVNPTRPVGRDVVMVLERRDLKGQYSINGVPLYCLDPLREAFIQDLQEITVYGKGWEKYADHPRIKVGHAKDRRQDIHTVIDILKDYTFVMIIENTDADGYVSEKIYDAWIAGCIPLYYGNNNADVGIPTEMYIDLRSFSSSKAVQDYLDSLDLETIARKRQWILDHRESCLEKVSTRAFADTFRRAYEKMMSA